MRKFLLATSAAALALTLSGPARAEPGQFLSPRPRSRRRKPRPPTAWCSPRTPTRPSRSTSRPSRRRLRRKPKPAEQAKPAEATAQSLLATDLQRRRQPPWRSNCATWSRPSSAVRAARAGPRRRAGVLQGPQLRAALDRVRQAGAARRAGRKLPARRRGRRPRSGGLSDAGLRQCRSGQARRRRTGDDEFRRHLRASRQHRPRGVHAGERRGLLRPEGARRGRRAGQARRQRPTSAPRSTRSIRRRRDTRRSRPSSPRSAAASAERPSPRPSRPSRRHEGQAKASRRRAPSTSRRRRRSSRRRPAPTPSSPTWSAGAGCRTISARPM